MWHTGTGYNSHAFWLGGRATGGSWCLGALNTRSASKRPHGVHGGCSLPIELVTIAHVYNQTRALMMECMAPANRSARCCTLDLAPPQRWREPHTRKLQLSACSNHWTKEVTSACKGGRALKAYVGFIIEAPLTRVSSRERVN
eukprot:IDg12124t1